jgi:hypothetical protein
MPTQHNKPELLGSLVLGTELPTEDNNVEMVGGPVSPAPGAEIPGDGKYPVEAAGEGMAAVEIATGQEHAAEMPAEHEALQRHEMPLWILGHIVCLVSSW